MKVFFNRQITLSLPLPLLLSNALLHFYLFLVLLTLQIAAGAAIKAPKERLKNRQSRALKYSSCPPMRSSYRAHKKARNNVYYYVHNSICVTYNLLFCNGIISVITFLCVCCLFFGMPIREKIFTVHF